MITDRVVTATVTQMINCESEITVFCSESEVTELINKLRNEHMILFHLGNVNYKYYPFQGKSVLYPEYLYKKVEYDRLVSLLSERVRGIKAQIMRKNSEIDKEFAIHDFLAKSIRYTDERKDSHSIVGPLLYGKGVCDGISKTAKVLFSECGIECHLVNGTGINSQNGKPEPHAWNIVRINGNYYHLDITYDNSFSENGIMYDFFNLSDAEILKDHRISEPSRFYGIRCVRENDYFVMNGIYFLSIEQLIGYCKKMLQAKQNKLYFRVAPSVSEQRIKEAVTACLRELNCSMTYSISVNSVRNIFKWEIEYK